MKLTQYQVDAFATPAAAHVIFEPIGHDEPVITFASRSGPLLVGRAGEALQLDFPACPTPEHSQGFLI